MTRAGQGGGSAAIAAVHARISRQQTAAQPAALRFSGVISAGGLSFAGNLTGNGSSA